MGNWILERCSNLLGPCGYTPRSWVRLGKQAAGHLLRRWPVGSGSNTDVRFGSGHFWKGISSSLSVYPRPGPVPPQCRLPPPLVLPARPGSRVSSVFPWSSSSHHDPFSASLPASHSPGACAEFLKCRWWSVQVTQMHRRVQAEHFCPMFGQKLIWPQILSFLREG